MSIALAYWVVSSLLPIRQPPRLSKASEPTESRFEMASPDRGPILDAGAIRRMTSEQKRLLSPEALQRLEQLKAQRAPQELQRRFASRQRRWLLSSMLWILSVLLLALAGASGWIGIRYGVFEALRYPVDRFSIERLDDQLAIRRSGLRRETVLTRKLGELSDITCRARKIGRRHATSYHWLVTLHSGFTAPRVEFYVDTQRAAPADDQLPTLKCLEFLRHLQQLTRCHFRGT
jgi:hypothetical protein